MAAASPIRYVCRQLGVPVSGAESSKVQFDVGDFELFGRYPTSRPYGDVTAPDKDHFKAIREKLKAIAALASADYSASLPMRHLASHTNPNGRSATSLWCCIYPSKVPNKSFGLQFALILNQLGAEFCFCLGAGTSQVAVPGAAHTNLTALTQMKEQLLRLDPTVLQTVAANIDQGWEFRQQWRLPPGTRSFPDLASWIAFASSPLGNGASISRNLSIREVQQLDGEIAHKFSEWANLFRPLFEAVYRTEEPERPDVDEEDKSGAAWIFQSNPSFHDLGSMLGHKSEFTWLAVQHTDRMRIGDLVFLWESGPNAGILALATIASRPALLEEDADEKHFNLVEDKFAGRRLRVRLKVAKVLEKRLLRKQIMDVPELANLSILKFANNTNFVVKEDEKDAILSLIEEGVGVQTVSAIDKESVPPAAPYEVDDIIADGSFLPKVQIEAILAKLDDKKNIILQGPPGTGKTWLAKRLAYALVGRKDEQRVRAVQFHPNFSYEDFVRGWRPTSEGRLSLVDGLFLEMVDASLKDADSKFVIVIEEINRGNPANIFGEMLTLLEDEKRNSDNALRLLYPDKDGIRRPIYIPRNLYVIGTMNVADRSLALVDLAFRRRFAFIDLEPSLNEAWLKWVVEYRNLPADLATSIERRISDLNVLISSDARLGKQFRIGHSYVTPAHPLRNDQTRDWFVTVVKTEIAPLLEEYWFDAPKEAQIASDRLLEGW